jgi:hypothetical protein
MNIHHNGSTVNITLHDGPTIVAAWDVLEESYGAELDNENLAHIVRKVENSSGYGYMTDAEREKEFWKELARADLVRCQERYAERCASMDTYDAFDDMPFSSHEVDPECQKLAAYIEKVKQKLEALDG